MIRQLGRALAYLALFACVGMGSAAGLTYLLLDDSTRTGCRAEPTATRH